MKCDLIQMIQVAVELVDNLKRRVEMWTEIMKDQESAENDMIVYHYSDTPIEHFDAKITCFFAERPKWEKENIPTKSKLMGKSYLYMLNIKKGRYIQKTIDNEEIRVELTESEKITYLGTINQYFVKVNDVRYQDNTKKGGQK